MLKKCSFIKFFETTKLLAEFFNRILLYLAVTLRGQLGRSDPPEAAVEKLWERPLNDSATGENVSSGTTEGTPMSLVPELRSNGTDVLAAVERER